MTYDEIKEAEKDYQEADRKWEQAKREYWRNTPPCANTSCSFFSKPKQIIVCGRISKKIVKTTPQNSHESNVHNQE